MNGVTAFRLPLCMTFSTVLGVFFLQPLATCSGREQHMGFYKQTSDKTLGKKNLH